MHMSTFRRAPIAGPLVATLQLLAVLALALASLAAAPQQPLRPAAPTLGAEDWDQLVPLMRAAEYQAAPRARDDGRAAFWAPNPASDLSLSFGPDGLMVAPLRDGASWSLSLRAAAYGPAGAAVALAGAPALSADGPRVEYRWPGLSEWYVNSEEGLKHNITLERPAAGQLQVNLALGGTLRPRVSADGQTVAFQDAAGATVLDFGALYVYDAAGATLPARFGAPADSGATLPLLVEAQGARFPITIDPLLSSPRPKLTPLTRQPGATYGASMAADGEILVVGAPLEDGPGIDSGAAYVFTRNRSGADRWGQVKKLLPATHAADDRFGFSVAVDGNLIVVGAPSTNQQASNDGAAYVFERHRGGPDTWGQLARLAGSRASAEDLFGQSVAVSGNAVAVGAPQEDSGGTNAGAVYLFVQQVTSFILEEQFLQPREVGAGDQFGFGLAMDGPTLVVGAPFANTPQPDRGAAYVFERNRGSADRWLQVRELQGNDTDANDGFGNAVAIGADTIVVGSSLQNIGDAVDRGAAYMFSRNLGGADAWGQSRKLVDRSGAAFDQFGASVAVAGEVAVVGAARDDNEQRGLTDSGKLIIFLNGNQSASLTAPDGASDDRFGQAVAISGDLVVGGAPRHDVGFGNSGAAYLFSLASENWSERRRLDAGSRCCNFGAALALDGDTLAVSAPRGPTSGSVYIFQRNAGGTNLWGEVARILNPQPGIVDDFGAALALDDNLLAVSSTRGVVYIFERNRGGPDRWGEQQRITIATRTQVTLALSRDQLWVGEPQSRQPGAAFESGQVEIFERHRPGFNDWGLLRVRGLRDIDRTPRDLDNFGRAVAYDGVTGVVTAAQEPSETLPRENQGAGYIGKTRLAPAQVAPGFGGAVVLDGDTIVIGAGASFIEGRLQPGAASIFRRNQGGAEAWGEVKRLPVPAGAGVFGRALGLDGDWLAVGAEASIPHGAVNLYERNAGGAESWGLVRALSVPKTTGRSLLGGAVALEGNVLAASDDDFVYIFGNTISLPTGLGLRAATNVVQPGEPVAVTVSISGELADPEADVLAVEAEPQLTINPLDSSPEGANGSVATGVPQGEITFFLDGAPVGTAQLDPQGQASITLPGLTQGAHELTASFAGNESWAACEAPPLDLFVGVEPPAPLPEPSPVFLPLLQR
jgi:hypothetical protein